VSRGRPTPLRLEWLVAPTPEQLRVRFSLVSPPGERSRVDLADGHIAASEAHRGVRHARAQDVLAETSARRGRLCLAPLLRRSDSIGVDHVRLVSSGMLGPPERTTIVRRATLRSDEGRMDAVRPTATGVVISSRGLPAALVLVDPGAHASGSQRADVGVGERSGGGGAGVADRVDLGVASLFTFGLVESEDR
jgi:hypothetical protein